MPVFLPGFAVRAGVGSFGLVLSKFRQAYSGAKHDSFSKRIRFGFLYYPAFLPRCRSPPSSVLVRIQTKTENGGLSLKTVNLKDIYPAIYTTDFFCQVSDSVAEFLQQDRRDNHAYNERRRVHKAYYSLSTIPESELILLVPSPETLYEQQAIREALYTAIRRLPDKQAARLYARYGLGLSISGIARSEGVTRQTVKDSLDTALRNIKKSFQSAP